MRAEARDQQDTDRVQRQEDPEGYVRRIVLNRYLNRMRSLRRERLVARPPEVASADRERDSDEGWRLLAGLPRQQRAVLVLRFYVDLSEAQIAETLGCSVGTVKSNATACPLGVGNLRRLTRCAADTRSSTS